MTKTKLRKWSTESEDAVISLGPPLSLDQLVQKRVFARWIGQQMRMSRPRRHYATPGKATPAPLKKLGNGKDQEKSESSLRFYCIRQFI